MNVISTNEKKGVEVSEIGESGRTAGIVNVVRGAVMKFKIVPGDIEAGFNAADANRKDSPVIRKVIDMLSRNLAGNSYTEEELREKWMEISERSLKGDIEAFAVSERALGLLINRDKINSSHNARNALR